MRNCIRRSPGFCIGVFLSRYCDTSVAFGIRTALRGHKPFQPGADRRPGADPRGYRTGAKDLLNNRMAYVAVSRGAYDAQIFTNDREKLGAALGHDVSHSSAHASEMKQEQAVTPQREIAPAQEQSLYIGLGL